jgi:hypothetical protein
LDLSTDGWFWCDEIRDPFVSACVWAESIPTANLLTRVPLLMKSLGVSCLLIDATGEPDLAKRLVIALNGLENYRPPSLAPEELLKQHLQLGQLIWDGPRQGWRNLRAAAVLFGCGETHGLEQTIGFTKEGRVYPLLKCDRAESIRAAVHDFLTPAQGVVEMVNLNPADPAADAQPALVRALPRARLPRVCRGSGVTQEILDAHLLNLRQERDRCTGESDWVHGVANHLGLAKTYARLAQLVHTTVHPPGPAGPWTYHCGG